MFRDCDVCPEMVVMPGGDPALGRYEVTVGEYRAFASATGVGAGECIGGSWRDPGFPQTDRHPVTCVSWNDAQAYVSWLSRTTGGALSVGSGCLREGAKSDASWNLERPDSTCPDLLEPDAGGRGTHRRDTIYCSAARAPARMFTSP